MAHPGTVKVSFGGRDFLLNPLATGGSAAEPKLKPLDELLLNWAYGEEGPRQLPTATLLHDEFGVLTTCLKAQNHCFVSDNILHHDRMHECFRLNHGAAATLPEREAPTDPGTAHLINLMRLPKSLDLFEVYLQRVATSATPETRLAVGFMTRHFSPRLLEIAEKYAATVSQSRAFKKARLLVLEDFLPQQTSKLPLREMSYREKIYRQYYGVFSASHIDYATQFLLEEWKTNPFLQKITAPANLLDVGCGNGVIGDQLKRQHYPGTRLAGTDVSSLAIASAGINLDAEADLQWRADLHHWPPAYFDLIVTNPPFHDGHRNTIDTSLELFAQAKEKLKPQGNFVVVANRHLNYATHLRKLFGEVLSVAENKKFVIYRCR
ncbi:class I SAM-dependent methyltransferase [Neolewinella agarilytica]|uniref:16S rRNA m(2)G 1207 methyltransferase /23S rRNA m(2)G-1835 methyltransferase n=1 Tax=Neolewinella agarilytica TaxID=478744 RepID=A0A1H9CBZ9_9BACT|nr:methyltransferase [Neolewinella agarilytica]SEP98674.1 16S rRNA m(2)G 1207 methyltransferase /23S rRNA m(2)G-1835 methyltransferase [Neolewinella agarilytica]